MIDWLVKRLSDAQKQSPRYVELAQALQAYWEENWDGDFQTLLDMRSIYTASDSDLKKMIAELGDRFRIELPTEQKDKPLALAWRRNEIQRKDTEFILTSSFRRHFRNLNAAWVPLCANKLLPYGAEFVPLNELSESEAQNYFLTSRGYVMVDMAHMHAMGIQKIEFVTQADTIVRNIKPLHIVYEGVISYYKFPIAVPLFGSDSLCETEIEFQIYDTTQFNVFLDNFYEPILAFPEQKPIPIDSFFRFDDLPADFIPTDLEMQLFGCKYSENLCIMPFLHEFNTEIETPKQQELLHSVETSIETCRSEAIEVNFPRHELNRIDSFCCLDDCPADIFPLDMPVKITYK